MGSVCTRPLLAAAAVAAIGLLFQSSAVSQEEATAPAGAGEGLRPTPAPKGPAPRRADGKPDLSGLWSPDRNFIYDIADALKPGESLPLQPWAANVTRERMSKDDPEANCLPTGVPRLAPYPWRIVQKPRYIISRQ